MSDKTVESLPDVIRAAAVSPLGILALLILVVGILGYVFFSKAPVRIRVRIFALIFLGAAGFGTAVVMQPTAFSPGAPSPGAAAKPEQVDPVAPRTTQGSRGDRSPNIAHTQGDVTVTFAEDPRDAGTKKP